MERAWESAKRLSGRFSRLFPRREPAELVVAGSKDALLLEVRCAGKRVSHTSVPWGEIQRVIAFKRDLFTIDIICLFIEQEDGMGYEVDEEDEGWNDVVSLLPSLLPGFPPFDDWFSQIAFPAFATNWTELWRRSDASQCRHVAL